MCNTFDKSRGMACMQYGQAQDPKQKQKQEENTHEQEQQN